jgi:hypothetical protein
MNSKFQWIKIQWKRNEIQIDAKDSENLLATMELKN